MISLIARCGRGLPAHVIPFALNEVTQLGLEAILAALAYGAERLLVLVPPKRRGELAGLEAQLGYAGAALDGLGYGGGRLELLLEDDPDAVEARLHELAAPGPPMPAASFLPMGGKRALLRLALQELHAAAPSPVDESRCRRARRSAGWWSTSRAARSASPASAPARPARWSTIRSGPSCASSRMPACSAASAAAPARRT